jgi:hypothetical protein
MRAVAVACVALVGLAPSVSRADGIFDIPPGWWTVREDGVTTCLEVHKDHTLRLTFQGPMDRDPVVVDGRYTVTATKMTDYHATLKVTKLWQKQLTHCRKAWFDAELSSSRQLGHTIHKGEDLDLTMHFHCADGHPQVQLCLHAEQAVCRTLANPHKHCTEGPSIDGSKYNAPPD